MSSAVRSPISRLYLRLMCWIIASSILSPATRTDRGRHRLLYQEDLLCTGGLCRLAHGALFDRRDSEGHADHDARPHQEAAVVGLVDEVTKHVLGNLEVGDDAILERTDRDDRARCAPQHFLCFGADREYATSSARVLLHRHHRRFVADDTLTLDIDQSVGSAKVNGEIVRKPTKHGI